MLLLFTVIISSTNVYSDNSKIKGSILDASSLLPIEYANLSIYDCGSHCLISRSISNKAGTFEIDSLMPGRYIIECDYAGYEKYSSEVLSIEQNNDTINAQNILLRKLPKVAAQNKFEQALDKMTSSRGFQMTYIGVPLIASGLIVRGEDDHFRALRNDYMPAFSEHLDDYIQYLPAAVMLGLKIGGVKGRSSWGRMLVSDAFSTIFMVSTVNILKHATKETRPDGSNNHSFPSGHTATAFMTATMLHKEYGYISPWISVGAYTVATATGLLRMANNKHWLSDVMAGAGIGILTTELGYYLADLIFKDKGLLVQPKPEVKYDKQKAPSFIGLYFGFNFPLSRYDVNENISLKASTGSMSGVEGAYFFNPYIGLGGRFTISNLAFLLDNNIPQDETFSFSTIDAGGFFSYPLSSRLLIGSKLIVGYAHYKELKLPTITIGEKGGFSAGTGASLTFRAAPKLNFKLIFDYNLLPPHGSTSKEYMHALSLGGLVAISL